jgi:hypothetical protein
MNEITNAFETIPDECRMANSKLRVKSVFVSKGHHYPLTVYLPLQVPILARLKSESEAEAVTLPVAVYELDRQDSKFRPVDVYIYKGDALK